MNLAVCGFPVLELSSSKGAFALGHHWKMPSLHELGKAEEYVERYCGNDMCEVTSRPSAAEQANWSTWKGHSGGKAGTSAPHPTALSIWLHEIHCVQAVVQ